MIRKLERVCEVLIGMNDFIWRCVYKLLELKWIELKLSILVEPQIVCARLFELRLK